MTHFGELDDIFRDLEESIRQAGSEDMTVPDIINLSGPALTETTKAGIQEYIKQYRSWLELAVEMIERDCTTPEQMLSKLAAVKGILAVASYYTDRLHRAVGRDRDVPWETRVAVDLMLTAFEEQLGA